jgi:hypothetical protein
VPDPTFRLVCVPAALAGAPGSWARDMLREGEIALLTGGGDLSEVSEVAHALELVSVPVIRAEPTVDAQEKTVIAYADGMPLIWVAPQFSDDVTVWARNRGPMTLLIQAGTTLPDDERRRIDRFVATLGRQTE